MYEKSEEKNKMTYPRKFIFETEYLGMIHYPTK